MAKKFFEVFPTLKLEKSLQDLFEQVLVEKVSATKRKDFIRIYISCDRLIQKETVLFVEEAIKTKLFPNADITIKIYDGDDFNMKKVGLALGGGAAHGVAHIGVLQVLNENNIPILVFDLSDPDNIVRALEGEKIGTIVHRGGTTHVE